MKYRAVSLEEVIKNSWAGFKSFLRPLATTRIASWDTRVKGIDDAAVRNLPITSISFQQWLDRFSPQFRESAMTRLSEIAARGSICF